MKVYYAHAMCTYNTEIERAEMELIRKQLPNCRIVDPGSFQDNTEKSQQGMNYCFGLIQTCNVLVFSRLLDKVTSGVGLEIQYALSKGIPVYELKDGTINHIRKSVKYLSRERTRKLYDSWRRITNRYSTT